MAQIATQIPLREPPPAYDHSPKPAAATPREPRLPLGPLPSAAPGQLPRRVSPEGTGQQTTRSYARRALRDRHPPARARKAEDGPAKRRPDALRGRPAGGATTLAPGLPDPRSLPRKDRRSPRRGCGRIRRVGRGREPAIPEGAVPRLLRDPLRESRGKERSLSRGSCEPLP